jgi:hypothetical protein
MGPRYRSGHWIDHIQTRGASRRSYCQQTCIVVVSYGADASDAITELRSALKHTGVSAIRGEHAHLRLRLEWEEQRAVGCDGRGNVVGRAQPWQLHRGPQGPRCARQEQLEWQRRAECEPLPRARRVNDEGRLEGQVCGDDEGRDDVAR